MRHTLPPCVPLLLAGYGLVVEVTPFSVSFLSLFDFLPPFPSPFLSPSLLPPFLSPSLPPSLSHFEDTQVELQEIKREYEREISELK